MSTDKAMVTDAMVEAAAKAACEDNVDRIHRKVNERGGSNSMSGSEFYAYPPTGWPDFLASMRAALSAALAQAEQPVAWLKRKSKKPLEPIEYETCTPGRVASFPVYAHPPAKREAGETAPAPVQHVEWGDWTVDDTDTAREILSYLGIGSDPSREPGADRRRDKVAAMIRARIDAAIAAAPPQSRERVSDTPSEALEAEENWQVEYEVVMKDGDFCASSTDLNDAMHYAAMYSDDGPVEIVEVRRRTLEASDE